MNELNSVLNSSSSFSSNEKNKFINDENQIHINVGPDTIHNKNTTYTKNSADFLSS